MLFSLLKVTYLTLREVRSHDKERKDRPGLRPIKKDPCRQLNGTALV